MLLDAFYCREPLSDDKKIMPSVDESTIEEDIKMIDTIFSYTEVDSVKVLSLLVFQDLTPEPRIKKRTVWQKFKERIQKL